MILEFTVKNTFSIKDEQLISFEASDSIQEDSELHCIEYGGKKFLKLACIYGANASGKTKIAKAFTFYVHFLVNSFHSLLPKERIHFIPFMFDEKTVLEPGEFNLVFYTKDFESENITGKPSGNDIKEDKNAPFTSKPTTKNGGGFC